MFIFMYKHPCFLSRVKVIRRCLLLQPVRVKGRVVDDGLKREFAHDCD
jgi:hypothetical protein